MLRWSCLIAVVACSAPSTPKPAAPPWETIDGGPTTGCSRGTPFRFFVHRGDPAKLAVLFQGGGACWRAEMCDVTGKPTFDPMVDDTDRPDHGAGVFDLANPANPIRDYTIVVVPYCTGDVHLGARDASYPLGDRTIAIRHRGFANASRVIDWTHANVTAPQVVLLAGTSAGAFPVPAFASEVATRHPRARVVAIADGDGSYRGPAVAEVFATWGAPDALASRFGALAIDRATISLETMIGAAAHAAPGVAFAELNAVGDQTQQMFHTLLGDTAPDIKAALAANLADVHRTTPSFRAYTRPGSSHTLLDQPELYATEVDGVRATDWVAALLAGRPVNDVGDALLR